MSTAETPEAYRNALLAMLPPGAAWPTEIDSNIGKLLLALGTELSRVEQRGIDVLREQDPSNTLEMLNEWEHTLGLPDRCSSLGANLEQRRQALRAGLTSIGGQSRQYFIDMARGLGFPGGSVREFNPHTVNASVDAPIYGMEWQHTWEITVPREEINQMTVESTVEDPLGERAPTPQLECNINRYKPAHTVALFRYTEPQE